MSTLKDTFVGFSKRFSQHKSNETDNISFVIITIRKISTFLKENIQFIIEDKTVNDRFLATIQKYTNLSFSNLKLFCKLIKLEDGEGDYNVQREDLRIELAQLIAGTIDNK